MSWLIPATIASLGSAAILALVYWYLYGEYRDRPLGIWACGWSLQAFRYLFESIAAGTGANPPLLATQLTVLGSAVLILHGTEQFVRRPASKGWSAAAMAGAVWILAAPFTPWNFAVKTFPAFLLFGAISAWTGVLLLKAKQIEGIGRHLAGWSFILLGLHQLDYPFLHNVQWLSTWGYMIAAGLSLTAAMGTLLIYFRKMQVDLEASQSRYRALFNSAGDAVFLYQLTPEGTPGPFLEVNDLACQRLGFAREELLKLTPREIVPPDQHELTDRIWEQILIRKKVLFENTHLTKDGTRLPVEVNVHLFELDGRPTVLSIARDISERKRAEQSLRESEEHFRQMVDLLPQTVFETDREGFIAFANRFASEQFGYPDLTAGISFFDVLAGDEVESARRTFTRIAAGESVPPRERVLRTREGRFFTGLVYAGPISRHGRIDGVRGLVIDISERKQAELALRESEERYRQLFKSNPLPMWVYDRRTLAFLAVNNATVATYGYSREEFLGMTIRDIHVQETIPELLNAVDGVPGKLRKMGIWKQRWKDGALRDVEITTHDLDFNGREARLVLAIDVTERRQASEKLRRNEERLRAFYESDVVGTMFGTVHGEILEANDEFLRIIGYTREEVLGGKLRSTEITPLEFLPLDRQKMAEAWQRRACTPYEKQYIRKDGSRVWVLVGFILMGEQREESIAFVLDLTARKTMEEELRESEAKYRSLFENSPISLWEKDFSGVRHFINRLRGEGVIDFDGYFAAHPEAVAECSRLIRIIDVNQATLELYEAADKRELLGFLENMSWEDFRRELVALAQGALRFEAEGSCRTLNGGERRVNMRLSVAPGHERMLDKVFISILDVTERKKTEESERRSRSLSEAMSASILDFLQSGNLREMAQILIDRCRSITEAAYGLIFDLDGEGNARFLAVSGMIQPDAAGERLLYDLLTSQVNAEGFFSLKQGENLIFAPILEGRTILTNEPVRHAYWHGAMPLGHPPINSFLASPLKVGQEIVGMIGLLNRPGGFTSREQQEVESFAQAAALAIQSARTELARNKAEEHLRQAQKMEAVGQLAGGIAHDFNNLLTVINGYGTLLTHALKNDDIHRPEAEHIVAAGERAAALTRQLLAFSRRQLLEPKVLNLNELVRNLEKLLRRLIREDVEIVLALSENPCRIKADPGQIEQILINFVVNARDAMPDGGRIVIETLDAGLEEPFAGATHGRYVMLGVSDTGTGMPEEIRERIFEPFFTTKEQGRGTGLGLATVYGIVKQSGGHIAVESAPGRGSSFKVYLPSTDEKAKRPAGRTPATLPLDPRTILVVEDEKAVLGLTTQVLLSKGLNVIQAQSGKSALDQVEQGRGPIDLLLTDIVMPDMKGPHLAETIRKHQPDLKVLYMSGYGQFSGTEDYLFDSRSAFLQKPFTADTLLLKVSEVLASKKPRRQREALT